MVLFTLPESAVETISEANRAALLRLRHGPYPTTELAFIPHRAHLYLKRLEGEVGLAQAAARYLVARLMALQHFTVSVPREAVSTTSSTAAPTTSATHDGVCAPSSPTPQSSPSPSPSPIEAATRSAVTVVPNRFQLAASAVKGTLRTAYPHVCADVFVAEGAAKFGFTNGAYATKSIAELVLTEVAPYVEEAIFAGALTAFFAHGVSIWTAEALMEARREQQEEDAAMDTDLYGNDDANASDRRGAARRRTVAQALWSLHRTFVRLSISAQKHICSHGALSAGAEATSASAFDGSSTASPWYLCRNMHQILALVQFMAPVSSTASSYCVELVSSLGCVYTREDAQYLLQMPLPLAPRHADIAAGLKEQSALCTMVRTVALTVVDSVWFTDWKWSDMKTGPLSTRLSAFCTPEEILILQQLMQWCDAYPELARSVVRDRMSISSLFKVEKLIEARVLAVPTLPEAEQCRHHLLYPVASVQQALQHGSLCTRVEWSRSDEANLEHGGIGTGAADDVMYEADRRMALAEPRGEAAASSTTPRTGTDTAAAAPVTVDPLRRELVGLINVGNTCFVNSVVQLLFRSRPFACALVRTVLRALARRRQGKDDEEGAAVPTTRLQEEDTRVACSTPLLLDEEAEPLPTSGKAPGDAPDSCPTVNSEDGLTTASTHTVPPLKARPDEPVNAQDIAEEMMQAFTRCTAVASDSEPADVTDLRTLLALTVLMGEMNWRIYNDYATRTSVDMRVFINALPSLFRDGQQHDASEFCKMLLELLDRAEKRWCLEAPTSSPTSASVVSAAPPVASLVESWFGGCMETRLRCCVCEDVRTSRSDFWDLSVVVPHTKSTTNTDPTRAAAAVASLPASATEPLWECAPVMEVHAEYTPTNTAMIPYTGAPADADTVPCANEEVTTCTASSRIRVLTTYGADGVDSDQVPTPAGARSANDSFESAQSLDEANRPVRCAEMPAADTGAQIAPLRATATVMRSPLTTLTSACVDGARLGRGSKFTRTELTAASDDRPSETLGIPRALAGVAPPIASQEAQEAHGNQTGHGEKPRQGQQQEQAQLPTPPLTAMAKRKTSDVTAPESDDAVDPRTVTIQHLVWRTADPRLNAELLTGDNQLRCPTCDARTDTALSTAVLAQRIEGAHETMCGTTGEEGTAMTNAASDDDRVESTVTKQASTTSVSTAMLGSRVSGVPHFLTLQLQRFAFDRTSVSFGKLLEPVAMEEVVLLPVTPRTSLTRTPAAAEGTSASPREDLATNEEAEEDDGRADAAEMMVEAGAAPVYVPYRLGAILVHSGTTPYSGHYYTLVRHDARTTAHTFMTGTEAEMKARAGAAEAHLNTAGVNEEDVQTDADDTKTPATAAAAAERAAKESADIWAYVARLAQELESHRVPLEGPPHFELVQSHHHEGLAAAVPAASFASSGVPIEPPLDAGTRSGDGSSSQFSTRLSPTLPDTQSSPVTSTTGRFLTSTLEGMNVTGHAAEGWVMVNDSHVMSIEPKRMLDILQGKRGVYSALETAYVLLYERVASEPSEMSADTCDAASRAAPASLPDFSQHVLDMYTARAQSSAAPPTARVNDGSDGFGGVYANSINAHQNVENKIWGIGTSSTAYFDEPHDGVAMGRPFNYFDTGTAGF